LSIVFYRWKYAKIFLVDLLTAYREDLLRRRVSRFTFAQYLRVVEYFLSFCKKDFSKTKILDFIFTFTKNCSPAYTRWVNDVLSSFFKRMRRLGLIKEDYPISSEDLPKPAGFLEIRRPSFRKEEVLQLIGFAKQSGSQREKAYLALATTYGLRREELLRLRKQDIGERLLIRTAKGGEPREHLIPEEIRPYLSFDFDRIKSSNPITLTFRKLFEKAKVPQLGIHAIRRSLNTELRLSGIDPEAVFRFLRWKPSKRDMSAYYFSLSYPEIDRLIFEKHPWIQAWG